MVASNSTTKQYYVNNNQRPWITAEIKGLMKQKHDANQKQNKQKSKEIQNDIKKLIKEAKIKYKEKMLAKMSTNIKMAWRGIKNMSNLSKPSNNDFDLLDVTEQRKLTDELNVFYISFDDPKLPKIQPEPGPHPVPTAEQIITVEEVGEQLRTCDPSKAH